jgi:transposase InsO family protein
MKNLGADKANGDNGADAAATPAFSSALPALPALTYLAETERNRAFARFQLLRPFLEDGVPLARLSRQHQLPLRTMRRWAARYQQQGLVGLARKSRVDRGQHRRCVPELVRLIEGLALQAPPPTTAFVHRQVCSVATQHGWPVPSYDTVYEIIRRLDPGLRTLAQDGSKVYQEAFDLLYRREATRPNEIWQADHCLLDIWLLDPTGKPRRPWLTVILDDYSRAVAGYLLSFQAPSALQTALALRQAIWRKAEAHWHVCGIPDIFYTRPRQRFHLPTHGAGERRHQDATGLLSPWSPSWAKQPSDFITQDSSHFGPPNARFERNSNRPRRHGSHATKNAATVQAYGCGLISRQGTQVASMWWGSRTLAVERRAMGPWRLAPSFSLLKDQYRVSAQQSTSLEA